MSGNDLLEEILGNNNMPSGGTSSGTGEKPAVGEKDAWGGTNLGVADPNLEMGKGSSNIDDYNWD